MRHNVMQGAPRDIDQPTHYALHLQANAQGAPAALQRSLLNGYMPAPACNRLCIHWSFS